ncbi:MAG: glycoside hydrolase family 3 C-terminal domain-containing protein [Bacteroidales bacterium]
MRHVRLMWQSCVGNHPLSYGLGWGVNHVASDGREDVDRQALSLEQEDLVRLVHAANPNTVLVIVSSFPYTINWSKEHIPAILHISQSSQELGNGLADVIFGKVSPAGRLVQTWPSSITDLPPILDYNIRNNRTYMYFRGEALFPFGYGLTYTSFEYSDLVTDRKTVRNGDTLQVSLTVRRLPKRRSRLTLGKICLSIQADTRVLNEVSYAKRTQICGIMYLLHHYTTE